MRPPLVSQALELPPRLLDRAFVFYHISFALVISLLNCNKIMHMFILTLVMLNQDLPAFANSVDPDQLASEEAN